MISNPQQVHVKSALPVVPCGYTTKPLINQLDHSLTEMVKIVGGDEGNDIDNGKSSSNEVDLTLKL